MNVLITGSAGFIGFFLAKALLARGDSVVGIDNLNDYYDPALKRARLQDLEQFAQAQQASQRYTLIPMDMADRVGMAQLFERHAFDAVVIWGRRRAGVRYSIDNPNAYVDSNVVGFVS